MSSRATPPPAAAPSIYPTPRSMRPSPHPSSESPNPSSPQPKGTPLLPPPALSATPPILTHVPPLRLPSPLSSSDRTRTGTGTNNMPPLPQALPPISDYRSPSSHQTEVDQPMMVRGRPYPSVLEPGMPPSSYCLPFIVPGSAPSEPNHPVRQTKRQVRLTSLHPYSAQHPNSFRPFPPITNHQPLARTKRNPATDIPSPATAVSPRTKRTTFYTPRTPAGILAEMPVTPHDVPHFALDYERATAVRHPPPGAKVRSYRQGHRPPPLSAELILRRFQIPKNGWKGVTLLDRTEKWGWKLEVVSEAVPPLGNDRLQGETQESPLLLPRLVCDIHVVDEFGRSVPLNNPFLLRKLQYLTVAMTIASAAPVLRGDSNATSSPPRLPPGRDRLLGQTIQSAKIVEVDGRRVIRSVFDTLNVTSPGTYTLCAKLYAPAKFIFSPEHMGRFLMASLAGHFGSPPSGLVEVLAEASTAPLRNVARDGSARRGGDIDG